MWRYWFSLPPEAQAAWAQAILSVAAIAVAIAIPAAQHLRERHERERRELREARALSLLLLPTLSIWVNKISEFERTVQHHLDAHFPDSVDWRSISDALILGEQGKMLAPKTHLMGPVADDAQDFFYYLATAQQIATERAGTRREVEGERESVEQLAALLQRARESACSARRRLHTLQARNVEG